jgi:hypothetical protein
MPRTAKESARWGSTKACFAGEFKNGNENPLKQPPSFPFWANLRRRPQVETISFPVSLPFVSYFPPIGRKRETKLMRRFAGPTKSPPFRAGW